ncbi:MAG: hypothetical protein IK059_03085 [Firmicutes bacterium]|nr:hypothetical protein [Bacillota bacterium]
MITMPETIIDRILHLPVNQIPMLTAFLDTLPKVDYEKQTVDKRIGIAKDLSFPANFDDIDYGTEELFGINDENIAKGRCCKRTQRSI